MKKHLAAVALAAVFAPPASAVTFPSLTTIYVGSGVTDSGGAVQTGVATSILCSNVSGVDVPVRVLILSPGGQSASLERRRSPMARPRLFQRTRPCSSLTKTSF